MNGILELSGLLHRDGSEVGTAVVTIFGPTVPAFGFTPFGAGSRVAEREGLECRPCDKHGPQRCPLGHFRCMRELEPRHVLEQLEAALAAESATEAAIAGQRARRPG